MIPNYRRFPVCLVRGEGSWIWDAEGNRYLDFFPGWGCNLLGHCPPRVVEAVREQAGELIHVPNTWYMEAQGALAAALSERSFGGQCFFCNSGAEANEAAIKLARAYGHEQGRFKIVTMEGGFHGRTYAALTATAQPKYHAGFEPMVPGFVLRSVRRPWGGRRGARRSDGRGPGRAHPGRGRDQHPGAGYLAGLRRLCDERGVLLILDEVQTGMGRTGEWFAYQHEGAAPDILTCAKALAGGIAAGVMIARPPVAAVLQAGDARRDVRRQPDRLPRGPGRNRDHRGRGPARARGSASVPGSGNTSRPCAARLPGLIREIRILGAMIGLDLTFDATDVVARCMQRRLLINATHGHVVRLLPALTITDDQIDEGCAILADVLARATY